MKNKVISILNSNIYLHGKPLSCFIDNIEQIYEIFQHNILESRYKNNILVTSEKIGVDVILLIISAINAYMEDLKNHNNYILSKLEPNQLVIYEGKKYKYIKIEVIDSGYYKGHKKIVLETKNGIIKINKSEGYKISRYFGDSDKLDNMEKGKNDGEGRYLISKLLNQDIRELNGILNQQILVVFKSKKYMEDIISNLTIKIDGEIYDFSRVFPSRYYSNKDNYVNIKGNKFHLKPIFLFTSRFDVADLILGDNEDCNKLILLDEKSYLNSISIIEDYTLEEEQLEKIIFYNTYNNIYKINNLIEKDVRIYAIEEDNKLMASDEANILVESRKINSLFFYIKKQLIGLLNSDIYFIQKDLFMINAFRLLKIFQFLCIPINELEEKNILDKSMGTINEIAKNNFEYESTYKKLISIYDKIRDLYYELYNNNPKFSVLENYSNEKSIIVVNNESELKFIDKNKSIKYKSIELIKNFNNVEFRNEKIIFVSFYNDKSISQINLYNSNNIINIFYYIEAKKYNYYASCINNNLKLVYDNSNTKFINKNKYIDLIKCNINDIVIEEKNITKDEAIDERIIELDNKEIIHEEYYPYEEIDDEYYYKFFNKTKAIIGKNFENSNIYDYDVQDYDMKAYKKVVFTNNQFAYLSKNYKVFCIDINDNYIVKSVDSLTIDDKVIFTNDKSDEDIDIMFGKIINSKIFKKQYNKDFENLNYFKNVIRDYAERYGNDYNLLSTELSYFNIEKVPGAIKQWTENKVVGPREKEVYKVVGKITRDKRLLEEWEDIYNSSEIIRKFKSRFKSMFKAALRSDIIENYDDEVIQLIIDIFEDRKDYIDIVEVEEIINLNEINKDVPLNCLLGEKYILQGDK